MAVRWQKKEDIDSHKRKGRAHQMQPDTQVSIPLALKYMQPGARELFGEVVPLSICMHSL